MMYLLDTNVISELRKAKFGKADDQVCLWAQSCLPASLFLSVITVLELELGTLQVERRDSRQGRVLRSWLDSQVMPAFAERIIPVDTVVAQRCARLHVPNPYSDRDALIAATALVHGLTVVTQNISDFNPSGVKVLNPWGARN